MTSEDCKKIIRQVEMMRTTMDILCDSFLLRAHDCDDDPLWDCFFHTKMKAYFVAQNRLDISVPEGDMIHDLIRDAWIDVKNYINEQRFGKIANMEQWFRTIRLDFPIDMCQDDTNLAIL
mgnify:FL=1